MEQPRLSTVEASSSPGRLTVVWADGRRDEIDLNAMIRDYAALAPLEDAEAFRRVVVGDGGWFVEWPDVSDDAALASDTLWRLARESAGDVMPRESFRDWRRRNELSLNAAAAALGLSRRQIAYYDSGEKLIPKYIALACLGYERLRDLPKTG